MPTAALQVVPAYLCPSVSDDTSHYTVKDANGNALAEFSRSHYVFSAGTAGSVERPDAGSAADRRRRVLSQQPHSHQGHYRRHQPTRCLPASRRPCTATRPGSASCPGAVTCPSVNFPGRSLRRSGAADQRTQRPRLARSKSLLVIHPPNSPFGFVDEMYSEHPGGANVLFGDGSVQFISELINQLVWAAMATRAGNETVERLAMTEFDAIARALASLAADRLWASWSAVADRRRSGRTTTGWSRGCGRRSRRAGPTGSTIRPKSISERHASGDLNDEPFAALEAIIAQARNGQWKEAESEVVRLAKAQRPSAEEQERLRAKKAAP